MTLQIRVYGIVQAVGFRPTVHRHAEECKIRGTVCNKGPFVEIIAQGEERALQLFQNKLKEESPKRSVILKIDVHNMAEEKRYEDFSIIESEKTKGNIFVSPDIAICEECKKELFDPRNRRYLHPFINCTSCGPRLTILDTMPYDRERTSMKEFPMCKECHTEYTTLGDRRYDAQPVCCNDCGPEVYVLGGKERNGEAITKVRQVIASGGIAAIKGIGGFHLCCDATNETAVKLLRERKTRPRKPFAVMMKNFEVVQRQCVLEGGQEEIITGHQKPILLLQKKENHSFCEEVAPGNPKIGVMLPYAPVQMLLFDYPDGIEMPEILVMTSGNVKGAPICITDEAAEKELGSFCDIILSNNRKILVRADDSVMDYFRGKPYMIRRSRGYAPLPVMTAREEGVILATGGELKNSFCIAKDDLCYLSPYVGDMEDVRTVEAFRESVKRMEGLLEAKPERIVCDLHPLYQTTREAMEYGLPVVQLQHHYAHILSCMAENELSEKVLGVAMDGTGYGEDGTIWGGEFLVADRKGYERVGSIYPFLQAGGDASAKEGFRIAVSMIYSLYEKEEAETIIEKLGLCTKQEAKVIGIMAEKKINTVVSTSAGRLFDAVSAILGICNASSFEGEAAISLQFAAEKTWQDLYEKEKNGILKLGQDNLSEKKDDRVLLRTDLLVKEIITRKLQGDSVEELAAYFHCSLAKYIGMACKMLCKEQGLTKVAFSGGVFQNTILLELCLREIEDARLKGYIHHLVPPNDGGLALGQAVVDFRKE